MKETTPVLNEKRRLLKGFMALLLLFGPAFSGAAEPRNFLKATLSDGADILTSPARLDAEGWRIAVVPTIVLLGFVQADGWLYSSLRGKQPWLDSSMPVVTQAGEGLYAGVGTLLLWGSAALAGGGMLEQSSARAAESLAFAAVASAGLKYAFNANRPSDRDDRHDFFTAGIGGSPSFPSGHSMVAFALAETYGKSYGRWLTYPLAAAVGYSRIYVGAHWPSDVLAGALLGAGLGALVNAAADSKGSPHGWKFSLAPAGGEKLALLASRCY